MPSIVDTPWNTAAHLGGLKAAGVTTVMRYYNEANSSVLPQKRLELAEAKALAAAGLRIGVVFEEGNNKASAFGTAEGERAVAAALRCAEAIGQPAGSAIYFAVDYDAEPADLDAVKSYFQAVNEAIGGYKVGAYGSGSVLTALGDAGLAEYFWLSMSMGWRDSHAYASGGTWTMRQLDTTKIAEVPVDTDEANPAKSDIGTFLLV